MFRRGSTMVGQRQSRHAAFLMSYAAVGCISVVAIVLFVHSDAQERFLMQTGGSLAPSVGQARLQSLAYTFTPEENPLEDFDDGYVAKPYSYEEDKNPFDGFEGYGFSTQTHAKGVSPYPATTAEDSKNVWETLPDVYPFDERKEGLKETFHTWNKYDWKQEPADAIKEVNVWDDKSDASKDSSWQLGDKMTFAWRHWEDSSHDQDSTAKALKQVNAWDNEKLYPTTGYKWKKTPDSVVDDPNDPKDGTEKNILMSYKFPNY
mmetsp:Transcript_44316/g.90451  ORF Transcript_44316/g.90451 Transcript_44316/m.90451 type:complete len:262 (+) Transcript_44316:3-788(+)